MFIKGYTSNIFTVSVVFSGGFKVVFIQKVSLGCSIPKVHYN